MKPTKTVYLNGDYLPQSEARVSVTDVGFTSAGGVYEVILFHNGVPYRLDEHLGRLHQSAELIGLVLSTSELADACGKLIEKNGMKTGMLYLQATYGDCGKRTRAVPGSLSPTIVILVQNLENYPARFFEKGVAVKSEEDTRWVHCNIKSIALLPNLIMLNQARNEGYDEVVFWDKHTGFVTECAGSNIFCIREGVLMTPPESNKILSGITRTTVLSLARANSIPAEETEFTLNDLCLADEVFVSSTTREIVPVSSIDKKDYSQGPGEITRQLMLLVMQDLEQRTGGRHWKRELFC